VLSRVAVGGNTSLNLTLSSAQPADTVVSLAASPAGIVTVPANVTVPAGQTVILMHFGVQRDVTDDAGAVAQAQALVNLTDPNALTGMSAAEQSEVINFVVP